MLLHEVLDRDGDGANVRLLGRGGSVASAVPAVAQLGLAIQTIERKALGREKRGSVEARRADADRRRGARQGCGARGHEVEMARAFDDMHLGWARQHDVPL
ncbi:hypothetical protein [Falsiroseomonas sp. HW251]|uniref:hypothetical protein n=1 Tax=Falsiroseomonas sp. HW251 TaxID=3390998 RepID=UPI003D322517